MYAIWGFQWEKGKKTRGAGKAHSSGLPCNCRNNEEFHLILFVTAIKLQGLAEKHILNNCLDGRVCYTNKQKGERGQHMYSLGRWEHSCRLCSPPSECSGLQAARRSSQRRDGPGTFPSSRGRRSVFGQGPGGREPSGGRAAGDQEVYGGARSSLAPLPVAPPRLWGRDGAVGGAEQCPSSAQAAPHPLPLRWLQAAGRGDTGPCFRPRFVNDFPNIAAKSSKGRASLFPRINREEGQQKPPPPY